MLRQVTAVLLLAMVYCSTPVAAQLPQVEPPPLVRLTGALQPLAEKSHSSLHTLTVSIQGQERLFRITKVEKLTGRSPDGWRLLQSLFPPQVRLVSAEGLLRMLQAPELEGIPLIIEGQLYVRDRMLLVTVVEEASKERQPPKPAGVL